MTPPRRTALVLLALPVLALTACGGGSDTAKGGGGGGSVAAQGAPSAQTATVVGNAKLQFAPKTVTAAVGTVALTLKVEGGVPHNLVFDDTSVGKGLDTTDSSATGTFVFPKAGTYQFVCTIHSGMEGKVVVS
ncbi:MAG: blue (type 1) copper domain protein [Frankiales bacterium]|nr:blue (type 1) copper domain protein [Frankiales bacterium]